VAEVLPSQVFTPDDLDAAVLVLVLPPAPDPSQLFSAIGLDQKQMADTLRVIAHDLDPQGDDTPACRRVPCWA